MECYHTLPVVECFRSHLISVSHLCSLHSSSFFYTEGGLDVWNEKLCEVTIFPKMRNHLIIRAEKEV
ncbi:hypothetical protein Y032_0086g1995 [Ancylostoma ceylanicum]|uniref:Uncharacterized protein n=1 Tax=Ancylostoma ceylanicum TaxID=53326 RepID=A0A016TQ71_9BILA|nr:hypothetical protein Y032_0086g1995 [Ancylostoma ceylanicum]